MNEQRLEALMYGAFREYDLGYRDEFWEIEVDAAENYNFYLPESNPYRLKYTSVLNPPVPFLGKLPEVRARLQAERPEVLEAEKMKVYKYRRVNDLQ